MPKRKYTHVLFDLDGTLTLSHPGIYAGIRHALHALGYPPPDEAILPRCIGPTLTYTFTRFFGMDEETAARATAIYRKYYAEQGIFQNEPMPYALKALKRLQEAGYTLALATSKPKLFADRIAEKFGFSTYLRVQVGCGMDGSLPTKASVIAEALRQLGADKASCLMVGDREHDAEGAKENGVACALVRVGYATEQELIDSAPAYVFDDLEKLTDFLIKGRA